MLIKKLEIEKTKPTFIISTFKTDKIKVGLGFSISNFFYNKTYQANTFFHEFGFYINIWVHENIIAIFENLLAPFLVIKDPSTIYTRKKDGKTGP